MQLFARLVALALCALLVATAPPQKRKKGEPDPDYHIDPYTENDEAALAAAGYVNSGSFHFAAGLSTKDVDDFLAGPQVRWVETAHFRIGSSLPEYTPGRGDKHEKAKLKEELARLKQLLPDVSTRARKLDPWLRVHLFALRAEELYANVQRVLGVDEHSFPTRKGLKVNGKYMGEGPYLGMQSKFNLLFFEKASSVGRCRSQFAQSEDDNLFSHLFPQDGTFLFAVSAENPGMESDTNMHCTLTYVMGMNMLDAFRFYRHRVPAWMSSGMGHWLARNIDPARNYFTQDRIFERKDDDVWDWPPRVRARAEHEYFPTFEKMLAWKDAYTMEYNQHMMAWSRVDFLMQTAPEGFATWFRIIKEPFPGGPPEPKLMRERETQALQAAWGFDHAGFDRAWSAWTVANYPKK